MSQGKKEKFNYQEARERSKKFIRYKDGTEIYSIGLSKFQNTVRSIDPPLDYQRQLFSFYRNS